MSAVLNVRPGVTTSRINPLKKNYYTASLGQTNSINIIRTFAHKNTWLVLKTGTVVFSVSLLFWCSVSYCLVTLRRLQNKNGLLSFFLLTCKRENKPSEFWWQS